MVGRAGMDGQLAPLPPMNPGPPMHSRPDSPRAPTRKSYFAAGGFVVMSVLIEAAVSH
jgi:hypothetical protein